MIQFLGNDSHTLPEGMSYEYGTTEEIATKEAVSRYNAIEQIKNVAEVIIEAQMVPIEIRFECKDDMTIEELIENHSVDMEVWKNNMNAMLDHGEDLEIIYTVLDILHEDFIYGLSTFTHKKNKQNKK